MVDVRNIRPSPRMLPFFSLNAILIAVFAILFYRAAQFDDCSKWVGILWAILSVALSLAMTRWLHWGALGLVLGQVALFVSIGVYRVIRDR